METVSLHYQNVLDNLSETLRADRRARFIELLQQSEVPVIPQPRQELSQPQLHAEIV